MKKYEEVMDYNDSIMLREAAGDTTVIDKLREVPLPEDYIHEYSY